MRRYGLIGFPLSHSFSKKYFTKKFTRLGISDCSYENFELSDIGQFTEILRNNPEISGLNITIPYKELIIPYLDKLSENAEEIGAVNTIQINRSEHNLLIGHNTDVIGFRSSLLGLIGDKRPEALILGTGGAAKAVCFVLNKLGIRYQLVSRISDPDNNCLSYNQLTVNKVIASKLIINTSPVGMYPEIDRHPDIPYAGISSGHFLFDLIYNPAKTSFLSAGINSGASIRNGLEMLELQAEASWEIWNS